MAEDNDKSSEEDGRTQIAVALRYEPGSPDAPKVVASGKGDIAEQILQIAFANGVKVREDADLAEILSAIDIDSEIPVEAFAAVAEILIYLYRANGNMTDILNQIPGENGEDDTTEITSEAASENADETTSQPESSKT